MASPLQYNYSAAQPFLAGPDWDRLVPKLEAARAEVLADVELLNSKKPVPAEKDPLDSGFIELPRRLLNGEENNLLGRMTESAARLREQIDLLVSLGIGGSYMGLRAIFEAVCHPYHNELTRDERHGSPRLYFEGDNLDSDASAGLLELLKRRCKNPKEVAERWGIVCISKSGGTLETAAAFRIYRQALETYYGADSAEARNLIVPVTGEKGKLRDVSNHRK